MSIVTGIHHISLKCCSEREYDEVIKFYKEIIGLDVARQWATGIMFQTGNAVIEVFNNGENSLNQGVIRHFAFSTSDVDECIEAVRKAGYEVFIEPKDIVIASEPEFPARIAFCRGPLGEEIEFFQEK